MTFLAWLFLLLAALFFVLWLRARASADTPPPAPAAAHERRREDPVFAALPLAALVLDARGRIRRANAAAARLLGRAPEALAGESLRVWVRDPDWWEAFARMLRDPAKPLPRLRLGGRHHAPLAARLDADAVLLVFVEAEAALAAEAARRRLVAHLIHDLRTPLASLLGWAETFLDMDDAEAREEAAATIAQEARALARLLDALLALETLAESGPEACDLAAVAREAVQAARTQAEARGIALALDMPEALSVQAPALVVRRMLDNLLANALRHARGHVRVSLRREGAMARLRVEDDGPGVPPEALPRLGERFFRVDRARTRTEGGHGLGLAYVRESALRFGGRVRFFNRPEGGFAAEVHLKAAQSPQAAQADAAAQSAAESSRRAAE